MNYRSGSIVGVRKIRRLGRGFEGVVDECEVQFSDGTRRNMARKTIRWGLLTHPEDVYVWEKTLEELRDAGLPVPRIGFARVQGRGWFKKGEFFMQLMHPERIEETKSAFPHLTRPVRFGLLRVEKHGPLIANLGRDLARLHNRNYPALLADFWVFVKGRNGVPTGRMILDVGWLKKVVEPGRFSEKALASIRRHARTFADRNARNLFLESYLRQLDAHHPSRPVFEDFVHQLQRA